MTEVRELKLETSDKITLYVHSWCVPEPKAAILLAHGMTEHSMRYEPFAKFLNDNGINFYCHDQRGHGKTADGKLGHLRKDLEWKLMQDDLFSIKKKLIDTQSDCPVFLMGHSMGSFLVRCAVQTQPNLFDGLIISGTGDSQGVIGKAGAMLATILCNTVGQEKPADKVQEIAFGSYNKAFPDVRTSFDWLTRDSSAVDGYIADPWCGFTCTNGFFHELLHGIQQANDTQAIGKMNKAMPVYLVSGDLDPVGNMGKGVKNVYAALQKAGMKDVTLQLYPEGRHEMLNELNKQQVMEDLLQWVMSRCGK